MIELNSKIVPVLIYRMIFGAILPTPPGVNNRLLAQAQPFLNADFPPLGLFRLTLMPLPWQSVGLIYSSCLLLLCPSTLSPASATPE